jgi:DNA-binding FrmR family transcriptional regulator
MALQPGYLADKGRVQRRLRRIEGQVRGLARMVDEERYCIEILDQIAAVQGALRAVATLILEDHLRSCVVGATADRQEQLVGEVVGAVGRLIGVHPSPR